MSPIDVTLIQQALRSVEHALEAVKPDPDPVRFFEVSCALINAKYDLRAALVGNVKEAA